jgi:lipopolysaccharide transport system permease protein
MASSALPRRPGLLRFAIWLVTAPVRIPRIHYVALCEIAGILRRHWRLLFAMAGRDISDRFVGSFLGVAWSVLHPLILMGLYVVIFSTIFKVRVPAAADSQLDFAAHMISAYLPWLVLAEALSRTCSAVSERPNLVKQVVFPLEILPLKSVLAILLPQLVGTAFLAAYVLVRSGGLPATWALWPLLFFFELMLVSGIAFGLAAVGVYFRDLKEIGAVVAMFSFYLTPILYSLEMAPDWLRPVLEWNPITWYVQPFRDACFFGTVTRPEAWIAMPIASVVVLVFGYRSFRRLKPQFANAL